MSPVDCFYCGQTWPEHPARGLGCPRCHAAPGSPCRRPSEHELYGGQVHREREQLAVERGFLGMCPEGPTARGEKAVASEAAREAEHPVLF